jgi:deoxyribonuclease-4
MITIGAHTSAAGGAPNALLEGKVIGASTVQIFTSNQKQWQGREILPEEVAEWRRLLGETGIRSVMSHASYLINLGSPDPEMLAKSRRAIREELERCQLLGIPLLNFHPGTATDGEVVACLDRIVESLLELEDLAQKGSTQLLLEMTAGQGKSVGHKLEHIAYIIQRTQGKIPIGVCIDTCHIFVAGYDIRTVAGWEKTLEEFDQTIGLPFLKAFHVNDSVKDLGSRVDRHAHLGQGKIGMECFKFLATSPKTRHLPMYLETPRDLTIWTQEIETLRNWAAL